MLGRESYGALRLSLQKLGSRFVRSFLRYTQSSLGLIHLLSGHIVFRKKGSNTVVVILSKLQLSVGRGLSSTGSLDGRRGCLVGTFCGADSALRPQYPCSCCTHRALFGSDSTSLVVDLSFESSLVGLCLLQGILVRARIKHKQQVPFVNNLIVFGVQLYEASLHLRGKCD